MAAHQAPPSLGFSRQEHWRGLPFPSPVHESEKWKWSRSVMSDSSRPHGLQPTRLLRPWDFPDKSTGVGCHCLLRFYIQWPNKTPATTSNSCHPGYVLNPTSSKEALKSMISAVYQWDDLITQECWLNFTFLQKNIIPSKYLLRATNSL